MPNTNPQGLAAEAAMPDEDIDAMVYGTVGNVVSNPNPMPAPIRQVTAEDYVRRGWLARTVAAVDEARRHKREKVMK